MGINRDKPDLWKEDIAKSVDLYNRWFMDFAPSAFRQNRVAVASQVERALALTDNLRKVTADVLKENPWLLPILRMAACPPIARERLVGLAGVSKNLVAKMEDSDNPRVPPKMSIGQLNEELTKIAEILNTMVDPDVFVWLREERSAEEIEVQRGCAIIADRLCGAVADPIIRNAQEKRQLSAIRAFLTDRGYTEAAAGTKYNEMIPGTFSFHTNVPVDVARNADKVVNIPVDVIILPLSASQGDFPLLLEAKSAGDFTNVNKRRKEEAVKMLQLRNTYGQNISYSLFLCGFFDSGYLGYEAAEGIDWIWEHRITDLEQLGI